MSSETSAAGITVNKVKSLSLYELIGAPLHALIQAEAQAMKNTVEYIRVIGFEEKLDADGKPLPFDESTDFGALRMISMHYDYVLPDGSLTKRTIKVPLLTIVPIPVLTVKNAEIEFSLKVADFYFQQESSKNPAANKADNSFLSGQRAAIKATMGSMGKQESSSSKYQIRVKMNVEQSDMPSGLNHLLRMANDSVRHTNEPTNG